MNSIEVRLKDCAAQENCDSEEYDLMQEAASEIDSMRRKIKHTNESLAKANERVRELELELTQVRADKGSYTWTKEQYEQLRKEQEDEV